MRTLAECLVWLKGAGHDVYCRKLSAIAELKKSLLHQAFTGQLTAKAIDLQVAEVA